MKENKKNICILCFPNDNKNYGANFVCYSMQKIIEKIGYNPSILNIKGKDIEKEKRANLSFVNFRKKYLNLTNPIKNRLDYFLLNFKYNVFISGSDQVFNTNITKENKKHYFLDFVHKRNGKIAFSASFGLEQFIGDKKLINQTKKLLNKFDYISLREKSAVSVLNKTFGSDFGAQITIDPTLMLKEEDYVDIINNEKQIEKSSNEYIATYILSSEYGIQNKEIVNLKEKIENKFGLSAINVSKNSDGEYSSFGQWLSYIKNAKWVITDSFHGVCFSIIFKKNFSYISQLGPTRVTNLLNILGLENLCYKSFDDICFEPIDYNFVDEKLNKLIKNSYDYLNNAIHNCL